MKRDVRNWVHSCDQGLRRNGTLQKHRHSLATWQPNHFSGKYLSDVMQPLLVSEGCIEWTLTTLFHHEGNAMFERTNKTLEESLSKYVDSHQHEWNNYFQLVLMAYRSSVHAVTKSNFFYVVLRTPLRVPIHCMYETRHTELFPIQINFKIKTEREMQRAHHLLTAEMDVKQTPQK